MTRKQNSMLRLTTCMAIVMLMCLSIALPKVSAEDNEITWDFGTENAPAEAALTKILKMGDGTTTPNATFEFKFTPTLINGSDDSEDLKAMPEIGTDWIVSVDFENDEKGTTANGTKVIIKESKSLFEGISWPRAGVYVYTVTEESGTYETEDEFKEKMIYSEAKYDLYVYISNGKNGTYVYAVGAIIEEADESNEDDVGSKVDPTPQDPEISGNYSKMVFTNTYLKRTTDGEDDPEDSAFEISKEVKGAIIEADRLFSFDITVSNPTVLNDPDKTYRAYVVDETGAIVTHTNNYATLVPDDNGELYIAFTTDTPLTVKLKHNQKLAFTDMYVGGSFTVTETGTEDYTPRGVLTHGAVQTELTAIEGAPLTVPDPNGEPAYIGEDTDSVAFTNTYKLATPTGISVNDLPYIVMIAVALAALAVFAAIKVRRNYKNDAR